MAVIGAILDGVMQGAGGVLSTHLTINHNAAVTTLNVATTEGWLKSDYVIIGTESVKYTNKTDTTFTNCERGYDSTDAVAHDAGEKVYTQESSVVNYALGFNVASTGASVGAVDIALVGWRFVTVTIPRIVMWDYSFLKINPWTQYIRLFLQIISVGFVIYMCYTIASALGGILQGIFTR